MSKLDSAEEASIAFQRTFDFADYLQQDRTGHQERVALRRITPE